MEYRKLPHGGERIDEDADFDKLVELGALDYIKELKVPGVRNLEDLQALLGFADAPDSEKDYSVIGQFTPATAQGNCVYCNHCQPCSAGSDVGLVNKYYDLALAGDDMAANHYSKLSVNADACIGCGHCDKRCPFHTAQSARMKEIAAYFSR